MAFTQLSGGRGTLRADAATSIARIDAQRKKAHKAPLRITSARRTRAQQEALKARWVKGGKYNRPPYLYKPAWYPPFPHESGLFIDTPDIPWMLTAGRKHGWRRTVLSDIVHFGYFPHLDKVLHPVKPKFKNIKKGQAGPRVLAVQKALRAHGYTISDDGIFGAKTKAAVRAFHLKHKMLGTGVVGPKTWHLLGLS